AEALEERRLFYVAMTRARERLILSGAAKLEVWPELDGNGSGGGPIAWIGPAVAERDDVAVTFVQPEDLSVPEPSEVRIEDRRGEDDRGGIGEAGPTGEPAPPSAPAPPVAALSYTSPAEDTRRRHPLYTQRG